MDYSALVRFFKSFTDFDSAFQNLFEGQRSFTQTVRQSLAFEILHDQVAGAVLRTDVVKMTDVGMAEAGDGARFAVKTLLGFRIGAEMRRQDLDGYRAVQAGVTGTIDLALAAGA